MNVKAKVTNNVIFVDVDNSVISYRDTLISVLILTIGIEGIVSQFCIQALVLDLCALKNYVHNSLKTVSRF